MDSSKVDVNTIESVANDKYPSDWDIQRFRHVFLFGKGLSITKDNLEDEGVPTVNYGEVHSKYGFELIPSKHALKCVSTDYLKTGKSALLKFGDFVFADTSEDLQGSGNFTYLNGDEQVFAGYHTVIARLKPKWRESLDVRFLAYLLDSASFRTQVRKRVKGVKVYSITQSILKDTYLPLPPKKQQGKIACFLDDKVSKINEAIAIKQKQIELLKEHKQIIIQQAVTQGLNPDAPMKDSGVDWIGEIPEHWEAIKLKHLFKETTSRTKTGEETLLSLRMERGLVPHNEVSDKPISAENLIDYKMVEPGQMVMNRMRAAIGIFGIPSQAGLVSPDYAVYNVSQEIVAEFYLLLFKTQVMGTQFRLASKGMGTGSSGFMRLYNENFGNIKVPFAPSVEQKEILGKIEKESSKLNRAIDNLNLSIDKLKEYKTTLINSAVTGKIKVTELA